MTNFFPPVNETSYRKKLSKLEWNKLNSELTLTEPKIKGSSLAKAKKVDSKKDGGDTTTPDNKFKGLAFNHTVPGYIKA